ncbi:uncharacterized protein EI90DRAFT_3044876 [Cantharellus anzutake]|uniref:uncharacterized protein n=1 Tax=Cantharellus anzutake TaxID=1750568 RepID=UPI00190490F9|nr:uncharacterized protein EI90DRAFT_3044876 [Cantharellus anzutake]KAF8337098.1 hypothetical protein EI90DRAFT_3044876 [Cantharellus anzutake]
MITIAFSDHSPEDITLSQHAADVLSLFNNIRTARRGGSEQALAVREFIVRRCAPIISHRLRSDKFIFQDTTLDQILQGWRPSDGDHFVKTECEIPKRLIRLFQTVGIQCRQSNGKCFAPWAKDIAPAWMEAFLSCLSLCKDYFKLEGKKVASNTTRGAIALKLLQTLVESEGFKYLLGLRSVNAILVLNRRQARSNTENTEDPSARSDTESAEDPASSDAGNTEGSARSNTENPEDSDDTHGDNLELTAETEEDAVALTTRYLGDAVAWITATDFLSGPRIRRTPRLRLHLAITAPPVEPKAMGDAVPIFTDIFNKTLKDWEDQSRGRNSRVRTWYWQSVGKLRKCKEFHGTIHCEASLMGAIVQYSGQANNTQNTQLPEIFHSTSNKPRTIGVAKKCCWCCSMLATLLNSTDIQFSLPGSHGRIFPWALPSMGISYEVACSLEEKLKNQLSLAIWKMLDELKHMSESQTSSPVSDGSSDELELELGSDRWNGGMDGLEHDLRLRNRILFPVS